MARTSIGLDIGTRSVGLAEVQAGSGGATLARFGRALLPLGAVDHGEVQDPHAVATAITALWKRLGLTSKAVHVGMANRRVVVRVIELPAMSKDDLAGAIRFQAQEHIPIPLAEAVMDFEVLEETQTESGERLQRVLVVAAERVTIDPVLAALKAANLEPLSLELNAYPLMRCFGNGSAEAEAIVDIGAGVTNVVVHREGKIRFTRILPTFGGDEFTAAVQQGLGVERDEAEALKRQASELLRERARRPVAVAVGGGATDTSEATVPVEVGQVERAASVIEPVLDRFVAEIRGSLDFYSSQPGAPAISRVSLTGGGALMGGIAEELGSTLGTEVRQGIPFENVRLGNVDVSDEERAIAAPFIGIAVGLALAGKSKR